MVPADAIFRHHYYDGNGYGGGCFKPSHLDFISQQTSYPSVGCAAPFHSSMGEERLGRGDRITSSEEEQGDDAGKVSADGFGSGEGDGAVGDGGWLQLGIGCADGAANSSFAVSFSAKDIDNRPSIVDNPTTGHEKTTAGFFCPRQPADAVPSNSGIPVSAPAAVMSDTITNSRSASTSSTTSIRPLFLPPSHQALGIGRRRDAPEASWGYWLASGASCSSLSPGTSCNAASGMFVAPLPSPATYGASWHLLAEGNAGGYGLAAADLLRVVVRPPSRPQQLQGLWFVLLAAPNQAKEPFLPQISKSYLRIKNGRMTVLLLMKYLVKKLGLINECEVEITCRGQVLPPTLTLQHVQDHIWRSREVMVLPSDSASNHMMTLNYGRRSTPLPHQAV